MTELERLFEPSETGSSAPQPRDPTSTSARRLKERVGLDATPSSTDNQALRQFLETAGDMPVLPGPGRDDGQEKAPAGASVPGSAAELIALVGLAGARSDDSGWLAPERASTGQRAWFARRKSGAVNFLSVAVAVLAILMLLGVGSFALVQRATANPADSAMASLREREAELANEISRAQTAAELYEASREQAAASASAAADVLESLDGTIEPETLAAAQAARLSLERVASTPIDASVPKYTRATIGEKSFQQVARAINTAQGLQDSLPELMTEVRRARADVMAASAEFNASMRKVAASLERIATARLSDTAASAPFLDAVSAATARVRDAQGAGGDGLTQIRDLVSALEALTSESERVLTERRDATDRSAPAPNAPQFGTPPVVEPTEPSPVPSPQEASPPAEPPPAPNPSPSSSDPGEGETG